VENVIAVNVSPDQPLLWGRQGDETVTAFINKAWAEHNEAADSMTGLVEKAAREGALLTWAFGDNEPLPAVQASDAIAQYESVRRMNVINGCCSLEEEKELDTAAQYYIGAVRKYLPKESSIGRGYIQDEKGELKNFTTDVDRKVVSDMKRARFPIACIKAAVLKCSPRAEAVQEYYQEAKKTLTSPKAQDTKKDRSVGMLR